MDHRCLPGAFAVRSFLVGGNAGPANEAHHGGSLLALVVNTVLNFALIPHWGMYGAAYATLLAYVMEATVMYALAQRSYRLRYDLPRTLAAMGVFAAVLAVTQIHWSSHFGSVIKALAGVLCFQFFDRIRIPAHQDACARRAKGKSVIRFIWAATGIIADHRAGRNGFDACHSNQMTAPHWSGNQFDGSLTTRS